LSQLGGPKVAIVQPSKSWDRFRWRSLSVMRNAGGDDGP
jgi:hypothetical protein